MIKSLDRSIADVREWWQGVYYTAGSYLADLAVRVQLSEREESIQAALICSSPDDDQLSELLLHSWAEFSIRHGGTEVLTAEISIYPDDEGKDTVRIRADIHSEADLTFAAIVETESDVPASQKGIMDGIMALKPWLVDKEKLIVDILSQHRKLPEWEPSKDRP